ncbi:MAG TPA: polyhydroxyalkanoate synthesis regulator DNA-binding domain-containing protein [Polyangiaceae bacterium]|nr:polyhydroxyalkanoate synthesis regulator DNA-binding domain-containing protein [Polyangiaceae bacterium]
MNDEADTPIADESEESGDRRIIKRYSNRKLYDTRGSSYVTLLQIAEMIRNGEDVQIIDNATKEDKTDVTLALIISEELRNKPRAIPIPTLKALIRHRGEKLLTQLREGPIGKLIPPGKEEGESSGSTPPTAREDEDMSQAKESKGLRATFEQWQSAIDERIRAVLPNFAAFRDLQHEVKRLADRIDELEKRHQEGDSKGPE